MRNRWHRLMSEQKQYNVHRASGTYPPQGGKGAPLARPRLVTGPNPSATCSDSRSAWAVAGEGLPALKAAAQR